MNARHDELEAHLARHVAEPGRWVKLAELVLDGELACVDGRGRDGVIGTPGGTTGELVLTLAAVESLGVLLDDAAVERLLRSYVDAFGRFYLHTDAEVLAGLAAALGVDDAWPALLRPDPALRARLLQLLVRPAHVGCGHLRGILLDPDAYGVRRGLVQAVLRGYFTLLWEGSTELVCTRLEGEHAEEAVVQVHVCGEVHPFTRVPLVAPTGREGQVFVHHPEVLDWLRRQSARWVAGALALDEEAVLAAIRRLGAQQLGATLDRLAPDLPVYDVTWCGSALELRRR